VPATHIASALGDFNVLTQMRIRGVTPSCKALGTPAIREPSQHQP
jgi:hypothetical protein